MPGTAIGKIGSQVIPAMQGTRIADLLRGTNVLNKQECETFVDILSNLFGKDFRFKSDGESLSILPSNGVKFADQAAALSTLIKEIFPKQADKLLKAFDIQSRSSESSKSTYPSTESLIQKYPGIAPAQLKALMIHILNTDSRFTDYTAGSESARSELATGAKATSKELATLLNKTISRQGFLWLHRVTLGSVLTDDLVALVKRPTDHVKVGNTEVVQEMGHLQQQATGFLSSSDFVVGTTRSSDAIKREVGQANANLGRVIAGKVGGLRELLFMRSANTATLEKLGALRKEAMLAALEANGGKVEDEKGHLAKGFHRNAKGELEFRFVVGSAMDSLPWPVKQGERRKLKKLFKFASQLPAEAIRVDGRVVMLAKPAVLVMPMSGFAYWTSNLENARQANIPAAQQFLVELAALDGTQVTSDVTENCEAIRTWYRSECAKVAPDTEFMAALHALHIMLSGNVLTQDGSEGRKADKATDPLDLSILQNALFRKIGRPVAWQCKSGEDRTLNLGAASVAAKAFLDINGRAFDPFHASSEDLAAFQRHYSDAANALGKNVNKIVRGQGKAIKWNPNKGGERFARFFGFGNVLRIHPGAEKYYLDWNKNPLNLKRK
jgi:hypothetical protein